MPDDVGEGFLQHAIQRGFDRGRQPTLAERQMQVDLSASSLLAPGVEQVLDRGLDAEIVERGRANLPGQPVDLATDIGGQALDGGDALPAARHVGGSLADAVQPSCSRVRDWPERVVQLAGDSQPLGFLVLDGPAQHLRQVGFGRQRGVRSPVSGSGRRPASAAGRAPVRCISCSCSSRAALRSRAMLIDPHAARLRASTTAAGGRPRSPAPATASACSRTDSFQAAKLLRGVRNSPSGPTSTGLLRIARPGHGADHLRPKPQHVVARRGRHRQRQQPAGDVGELLRRRIEQRQRVGVKDAVIDGGVRASRPARRSAAAFGVVAESGEAGRRSTAPTPAAGMQIEQIGMEADQASAEIGFPAHPRHQLLVGAACCCSRAAKCSAATAWLSSCDDAISANSSQASRSR